MHTRLILAGMAFVVCTAIIPGLLLPTSRLALAGTKENKSANAAVNSSATASSGPPASSGPSASSSPGVGWGFNQVTFATLSDIHLGLNEKNTFKRGGDSDRLLKEAIDAFNADRDLDFVLLPGDLLTDGEPWNLDRLLEQLSSLKVPYYVVPGNHDQPLVPQNPQEGPFHPGISAVTLRTAFIGHGIQSSQAGWWSADPVPGLHLIGLDTVLTGTWKGRISSVQLKWLEADLTLSRDKLTLVVSHHGLVPFAAADEGEKWKSFQAENAAEVRAVLERFPQVQGIISGHHHMWSYKQVSRKHYFSVPSLTSYPLSYVLFELSPQGMKADVRGVGTQADRDGAWTSLTQDAFWTNGLTEEALKALFMGPKTPMNVLWMPFQ